MRQQKLVISVNKHKLVIASIAIFFVAIITGFVSESQAYLNGGHILRSNLIIEMARVLKCLNPVINQETNSNKELPPFFDLPKQIKSTVVTGIIKSLPDGSWKFKQPLTKGETVYYLSKLINYISENLKYKAKAVDIEPSFTDINKNHWLYTPLHNLSNIGVQLSSINGRLNPDALITTREVKRMTTTIIDYYSSNLLILIFDGIKVRIFPKGTTVPIDIKDISLSFNDIDWQKAPNDGRISPSFNNRQISRLYFKHPAFFKTNVLSILKREPTIAFIKLRRNYANFTQNLLNAKLPDRIENSKTAHQRLKQRLAEIKQRNKDNTLDINKYQVPKTQKSPSYPKQNYENIEIIPDTPRKVYDEKVKQLQEDHQSIQDNQQQNVTDASDVSEIPLIEIFQGYVVNAKTRKGLKGAVVLISGKYYTTDKQGKFIFEAKRHKSLSITAYSEGFIPLKLKSRAGYKNRPLRLAIKPIRLAFSGRVINSAIGSPISKALVKVGNKVTRSSIDGSFKVKGLKPGYHQLSCFVNNYTEVHEIVFVDKDNNKRHQLSMRPLVTTHAKPMQDTYFMNNHDELSPEALLNQNNAITEYQNWVIDKY